MLEIASLIIGCFLGYKLIVFITNQDHFVPDKNEDIDDNGEK